MIWTYDVLAMVLSRVLMSMLVMVMVKVADSTLLDKGMRRVSWEDDVISHVAVWRGGHQSGEEERRLGALHHQDPAF